MFHKVGVIFAMQKELELFADVAGKMQVIQKNHLKFYSGTLCDKEITAMVCGVGKVNAALGTRELIETFTPDIILNVGISGGLDTSLEIGDCVLATAVVYHDVWCGEPNFRGQVQDFPLQYMPALQVLKQDSEYKKGLICCGDQFITTVDGMEKIKSDFPDAIAVDMESAAIAQTCFLYQKPFLSVRQISDVPGGEHHARQYEEFWKNAPENSIKILRHILEKIE